MIEIRRFGDFASFKYGKMPDKKKISESGKYPVYSGYRYVGYYDEYNVEANTLIIVARGVGGTGDVKITSERCYLTNLSISAEINRTIALPEYLYYYYMLRNLRYLDSGSAQSQITISDLEKVEIPLPSIEEQKATCNYLKLLDSKIDINNVINQNLSEQIQTIYDELIEKIDADPIEISSVIDVRDGTHDSPKAQETGLPLVTSKHLLPYGVDLSSPNRITKDDYDKINERSRVDTFDILLSMIGTVGIISLVVDSPVEFAIKNVGLFKTSATPELYPFVLAYLRSKSTMQHIEKVLAGSTQKYVSLGELRKLPIALPNSQQLIDFNAVVKPIIEQIIILTRENKQLTVLRDSLLPKLMSGELDVSEIEI